MQPLLQSSPEDELLLLLVQRRRLPHSETRIHALLHGVVGWSSLLQRAHLHGVVPLLAHHLQLFGYSEVLPAVVVELQRCSHVNCARNLLLARELGRVLQQLGIVGIPVIPLKGVVLAEALYGDCTLRVCSDLAFIFRWTFPRDSSIKTTALTRKASGFTTHRHDVSWQM